MPKPGAPPPLPPRWSGPPPRIDGWRPPADWQADMPSRWNRGAWLLRDSTLQRLEFLLDEAFRVPGTSVRLGLDGIVGIVPGIGDVLAGLLSLIIPLAAWVRGVPYITLIRMIANVGIGVVIGSIPLFGDIFDIVWKSNRRNYRLLSLHIAQPRRHTTADWIFLLLLVLAVFSIFAVPIILAIWLLTWLNRQLMLPF